MAVVKKGRSARWAGVEFQPDLKNPRKPVRLGAVLYERSSSGQTSVMVVGRVPAKSHPPPEFEHVSPMIMTLAADWVDGMVKDLMEANPEDPLAHLATRWRWNLYLIDPVRLKLSPRTTLVSEAKRVFEKFVREPWNSSKPPRTQKAHAQAHVPLGDETQSDVTIPPAWLIEQVCRSVSSSLGA
jgi:hypothetical protein